eukprot:4692453-Lingulodinium_polyedra.AAC.1
MKSTRAQHPAVNSPEMLEKESAPKNWAPCSVTAPLIPPAERDWDLPTSMSLTKAQPACCSSKLPSM